MQSKFFLEEKPIYTSKTGNKYTKSELIKMITDYKGSFIDSKIREGALYGSQFHEAFPREDINLLFRNKEIYDSYENFVQGKGAQFIRACRRVNDDTVQILKDLAYSGRDLVKQGWQWAEDEEITKKIAQPIFQLSQILKEKLKEAEALDVIANYLEYKWARGSQFTNDVRDVAYGGCAANFIPMVSQITAFIESVHSYLEFVDKPTPIQEV